jgi:hypothetical protein
LLRFTTTGNSQNTYIVARIREQRNATVLNLSSAMKTAVIVILCIALAPALLIGAFVALDWALSWCARSRKVGAKCRVEDKSAIGPRLLTWAMQQVGSYVGYTGRAANVVAPAALAPTRTVVVRRRLIEYRRTCCGHSPWSRL